MQWSDFEWCPLNQGEWVYTFVEDLTLHCFSTSTENLEQAMSGEWVGYSVGDVCTHAHMYTYMCNMWTCRHLKLYLPLLHDCHCVMCPYLHPSPQVHAVHLLSIYPLIKDSICACTRAGMHKEEVIFISCLSLCNVSILPAPPSQVHVKDVIVLEPPTHHTLLASFGEDTVETEEDIDNTHMWCEV